MDRSFESMMIKLSQLCTYVFAMAPKISGKSAIQKPKQLFHPGMAEVLHRAEFYKGAWDPGSKEIIKTHKKSLLELMHLTFPLDLLSDFPVYKNKFLLIRIVNWKF